MKDKSKKPQKLKARLPRGLEDRGPAAINATRQMVEKIRAVYELYGFEPVETPDFEYTDALGKFLPDQDRPNEGVFSFQDDDEQWISLRYDLTAPLARYVAENFDQLPKPYRSYRFGWVFRKRRFSHQRRRGRPRRHGAAQEAGRHPVRSRGRSAQLDQKGPVISHPRRRLVDTARCAFAYVTLPLSFRGDA